MRPPEVAVIVVPVEQLSPEALRALVEEFVTRHGAIQGQDVPLETKVAQVRRLLDLNQAAVVWDEQAETVTILMQEELRKVGLKHVVKQERDGDRLGNP